VNERRDPILTTDTPSAPADSPRPADALLTSDHGSGSARTEPPHPEDDAPASPPGYDLLDDRNVGLADKAASPSSNPSRREEEVLVEESLVQLPDDYRQVILLRHREHRSFADAARVMNRSEEAIKSLWARAIKKLQIILGAKSR
jgi:RNA polymerase sigma factor (sigma-70 family)